MRTLNTKSTIISQIRSDLLTILITAKQINATRGDIRKAVKHYLTQLGAKIAAVDVGARTEFIYAQFQLNNEWHTIEVK